MAVLQGAHDASFLAPAGAYTGGMTYTGRDPFEKPPLPPRFNRKCPSTCKDGSPCEAAKTATGYCVGHNKTVGAALARNLITLVGLGG